MSESIKGFIVAEQAKVFLAAQKCEFIDGYGRRSDRGVFDY